MNEADPLLNVVNAGSGKEATDVKVKGGSCWVLADLTTNLTLESFIGGMEFHIKLAECKKVALAGLSDGAYASMLKYVHKSLFLQIRFTDPVCRTFITRGQREKVVILKSKPE